MKSLLILLLTLSILSPLTAVAQAPAQTNTTGVCNNGTCTYTPLEPIPGLPQNGTNFAGFLNGMFKLLFTIGGMVAVGSLVYGGVTYMVSEVVSDKGWAKRQMRAALWGLGLLVAAWLILYTINPQLIQFNFNPVQVSVPNTGMPNIFSPSTADAQNLGNSTQIGPGNPYGFSSLSLSQRYAVSYSPGGLGCTNDVLPCLASGHYITFSPGNMTDPAVKTAIDNYKSDCESVLGNAALGTAKTVDGSLVGASGQTAMVCASPIQ